MSSRPSGPFRFCPYCGAELDHGSRLDGRLACPACRFVAYRNPTVGVAVVVRRGDHVLLGKRRGSYAGAWCIPCGHVEWDEDLREAAVREFAEETGLHVRLGEVLAVHSNFHDRDHQTVGVWFKGEVTGGELRADDDLIEVDYFPLDALPAPLAFPTDECVLRELLENLTLRPTSLARKRGA